MTVKIFTDGGSRGNPGHAGFGVVIYNEKEEILFKIGKYIGIRTNNEAEYEGLLEAVSWIRSNPKGIEKIEFYSDSQLMMRQLQGVYKVKAPTILPLHKRIRTILDEIQIPCEFNHVYREKNQLADGLVNEAIDGR